MTHSPDPSQSLHTKLMQANDFMRSGQHAHAAAIVEGIGAASPDNHEAEVLRLKIAAARQDHLGVLQITDRILESNPGNPQLIFNRIHALYSLGRLDEAIAAIDQELPSANPQLKHNLTALRFKSLQRHGTGHDLREILDSLVAVEGKSQRIVLLEVELLRREGKVDEAIVRSNEMLERNGLSDRDRDIASLNLARLYDQAGRYDEAFGIAKKINENPPMPFDSVQHVKDTDQIINAFTAERLRNLPHSTIESQRPVFIVGMPRSGTSVLEQIIASHPRGDGLSERQDPIILSEDLSVQLDGALPDVLDRATPEVLDHFANRYLKTFDDMGVQGDRVVNKALELDRLVGFLTVLLPEARFVWIHRNPADNLLSIYLHFILKPWAWRLEDLIVARQCHDRLRNHWLKTDPKHHLSVSYEELTRNQYDVTNQVLGFLDLQPDEQTIEFHQNTRAVMTPSASQVTQPMNRVAVDRWKNYAEYLRPVLETFKVVDNSPE